MNHHHHHHHHRRLSSPLSPRSFKTRFAVRFLRALRKIRDQKCTLQSPSSSKTRVKTAADASMAYVVGNRRAWSRAMLLKLRWRRRNRSIIRIRAPVIMVGGKRMMRKKRSIRKMMNQSNTQEEQLRKLVPGGELMDTYNLLDETAHYVKCLAAQVLVMRNIVNHCST